MATLNEMMQAMNGELNQANGGLLGDYGNKSLKNQRVYGYEIRPPYDGENAYFKKNVNVTGMAGEDGKITMNPYSKLSPEDYERVLKNEASRLYMREKGYKFDFPVPQVTQSPFKGTIYAEPDNLHHLQSTIIARGVAGDKSAGEITPAQQLWINRIKTELSGR